MKNKNRWVGGVTVVVLFIFLFSFFLVGDGLPQSMDKKRTTFISLKKSIQQDLIPLHKYRCCLQKPCSYCIEKTPGHGEGASCDCMKDVVEGKHPCGECIGEILEGHGNPYLAEYFAQAIADEVGKKHLDTLREIISEKYNISVEAQA